MTDKETLQVGPWLVACDVDEKGDLTVAVLEDCSKDTKLHKVERFEAQTAQTAPTNEALEAPVLITALVGDKEYHCDHCSSFFQAHQIPPEVFRGQRGPWMHFDCPRCRNRLKLDGRLFPEDVPGFEYMRECLRLEYPEPQS